MAILEILSNAVCSDRYRCIRHKCPISIYTAGDQRSCAVSSAYNLLAILEMSITAPVLSLLLIRCFTVAFSENHCSTKVLTFALKC